MLKAYKYRLYPTESQADYLNQVFGCTRFVWNQLVANFNSYSKDLPNTPMTEKILKDDSAYSWLNGSISYALQQKRMDFEETKHQYFSKTRKTKLGRMKFKSKGISNDSFRIPGQVLKFNKCIDFEAETIKIPKMPVIKLAVDREFTGTLRAITVTKNKCNQYFVSVLVDEPLELKQNTGRSIGIDLGLTDLCILSNGIKVDNPRWFRENQSKLKRAQQHLSRKVKGSNRRSKARIEVAKIHQKIKNQRSWFLHNLSAWLVSNYDLICTENLKVSNMVKNHKLAKSINDASWSELVRQLEYKSNWYGKTFTKIDTWFPSSKTCSYCGAKVESLPLNIREWTCSDCNIIHDRDLNAATNILNEGLRDLYQFTSAESVDYKRREELSPALSAMHPIMASSMKRLAKINFTEVYCFA